MKCVHEKDLREPCKACVEIEATRRTIRKWTERLRGTPLGRLCNLKDE